MLRVLPPYVASDSDVRTADLPSKSLLGEVIIAPASERIVAPATVAGPIRWEPPSVAEASAMLPDYEISGLIGRGGMGAVYKARHLAEDRAVAIKLLPPEVSEDEGYRKRFEKETLVQEHLRHPRIVSLLNIGQADGSCYYFVMEYVDGTSLVEAIRARNLPAFRALQIMRDVCEALAYAHDHGVIHRDLKPGNVLLDSEGRAKLADFGTAQWRPDGGPSNATTGVLFGTWEYMAPEILAQRGADARTDIFSLGVMFYEMLCFEWPRGHYQQPSEKAGVPQAFDLVVSKAMHANPEMRYSSVAEMLRDIASLQLPAPCEAKPPVPAPGICRATRGTAVLPRLVVSALCAAGVAAALLHSHRNADRRKDASSIETAAATEVSSFVEVLPPDPPEKKAEVAPPAASPGWRNWLAEHRELPHGLAMDAGGSLRTDTGSTSSPRLVVTPNLADQAVRIAYTMSAAGSAPLKVYLRASPGLESFYVLFRGLDSWQLLRRKNGKLRALCKEVNSPESALGKNEELEFSARGSRLVVRCAGEVIFDEEDDFFMDGSIVLEFGSDIALTKIDWSDRGAEGLASHAAAAVHPSVGR